jgi:hypothetical protein
LRRLPQGFQYAVEIRNDDFLDAAYFDVLKANGVAHIFTSWSRMPSQQLLIDEAFTAAFTTARALLRPLHPGQGRISVVRQALRDLFCRSLERDIAAYIHVNNRLEGNAIQTIDGVVSRTDL